MTGDASDGAVDLSIERNWSYRLVAVAGLVVGGFLLLAAMMQSEWLLAPYWLEDLSRAIYKLAFFIVLPFRSIVFLFMPRVEHHWTLTHYVVTCLGTPFFYFGVWRGAHVLRGWFRGRKAVRTVTKPMSPAAIDRRQFLIRSTAGAVGVASGGLGSYASLVAPEILHVRRYVYPIANLPDTMDGLRIVHVSDTHYGPFVSMPYLNEVFNRANALEPDLVVLTGDHVHYTPDSVEPGIQALGRLRGRLGVVAVMGNHEHWEGAELCREQFRTVGIPLLDNARTFLTARGLTDTPSVGEAICVAGVGDKWEDVVDFDKALSGVPTDMPRLLLSHNPDVAEMSDHGHRIDLMFSGHTHGGQIALPIIGAPIAPSDYGSKYIGGACYGPHYPVVVSRGVGVAGVPLRLGVPPEIGVITLVRA